MSPESMIPNIEQHLAECLNLLQAQRAPLLAARNEARAALEQADKLLKKLDDSIACLHVEKRPAVKRKGTSAPKPVTSDIEQLL